MLAKCLLNKCTKKAILNVNAIYFHLCFSYVGTNDILIVSLSVPQPKVINLFFDFWQQIDTAESYTKQREDIMYIMTQNKNMNNGFKLGDIISNLKIFNSDFVP